VLRRAARRPRPTPHRVLQPYLRAPLTWKVERGPPIVNLIDAEWTARAACKSTPPQWWYPDNLGVGRPRATAGVNDHIEPRALALCAACMVRSDCLDHALRHERYGIWAATTPRQRHQLRRRAGIRLRELAVDDVIAPLRAVELHTEPESEEDRRWQ
jgi:hypothetical protein